MSISTRRVGAAFVALLGTAALAGCAAQAEREQFSQFEQAASEVGFECVESVPTDGIDAQTTCQNGDGESLELVTFDTPSALQSWTDALVGSDEDLTVELFEDGHTLIAGTDSEAVADIASVVGKSTPLEV